MNHPAVTVLQQVTSFTVNAAGSDAIGGEVLRVYGSRLAISPRRREVLKLKEPIAWCPSVYHARRITTNNTIQVPNSRGTKEDGKLTKPKRNVSNTQKI